LVASSRRTSSSNSLLRRLVLLGGALVPLAASAARAQGASSLASSSSGKAIETATPAAAEALLDWLVGTWQMVGHVRGKPDTYALAACRVLGGRYVELHMTDVQRPPQYEARVFIRADTTPARVFVHWIDSFGAAFSVPHATGAVMGDTLRFEFGYSSGPFRDTFVYDRKAGRWTFRLEAGDGRGVWRPFADYKVRPEPRSTDQSSAAACR
jgi:hypothetical protein